MPNVEFEDSAPVQYTSRSIIGARVRPTMIDLVKKIRLAKTDAQAYYALIILAVICFAITAYITFTFVINPQNKTRKVMIDQKTLQGLPPDVQTRIKNINSQK